MRLIDRFREKISEYHGDTRFFGDYSQIVSAQGELQDKLQLVRDCEAEGLAAVSVRNMKAAAEFMDLQKSALLMAAPDDLDSFIQYAEWEREPKKRFYFPRRKQLLPIVQDLQALADDKLDILSISLPPGVGKLLADDTPVMTKDGWKRHGDLVVGDYVVGMDGRYKRVERVYPKDYADYEIEFTNGERIQCHGNHEWLVENRNTGSKADILTTEQMANMVIERGVPNTRGHRYMFLLPHRETMVGSEQILPVDPYVFGAWIGDGTTSKPGITICNKDIDILYEIVKRGYGLRKTYEQVGCKRYEFNKLRDDLHKLGLCNYHKKIDKFIPEIYLKASLEQRLSLMAGLVDTDGSKKREGTYSYSTTNEQIRDSVCALISTFGWRYNIAAYGPTVSSSGIRGKHTVYTINFTPTYKIPCIVQRKKMALAAKRRKIAIKSIRKIDPVPGNCIQVEGGMYCAGKTMLPTHNSTTAIFYICWLAGKYPDEPILTGSHSNSFIRGVYDECLRILDPRGEYLWRDVFPGIGVCNTNAKDCRIDVGHQKRFETLEFTSIGTGNAGLYRAGTLLYCDDLVSGIEVALSVERLDKLWEIYTTDLRQRKKGEQTKELHIATRWSVHDVIGRLERIYEGNPRAKFIAMPAMNENDESNFDYKYGVGFSTEFYRKQRDIMDDVSWLALYQNQPIEREGLLYHAEDLQWYFDLPDSEPDAVLAVCDTKDKGSDYCVMPVAYQYGQQYFIEDFICDNSNPDEVEARLVSMLLKHHVHMARFESNSAGGRIAQKVQELVKAKGGRTKITTKYTTANKETKIITAAGFVKEHFLFKSGNTGKEYQTALKFLTSYTMVGKNKHDDVPDAVAMLVDFIDTQHYGTIEVRKRPF